VPSQTDARRFDAERKVKRLASVGVRPRFGYSSATVRRLRFMLAFATFTLGLLTFAPMALAKGDGGQGWFGQTTDANITNAMFITIAFFPTLILILSLIQWRLDKRKHARLDAARARERNVDWRGGW
jgi:hypothetical protein